MKYSKGDRVYCPKLKKIGTVLTIYDVGTPNNPFMPPTYFVQFNDSETWFWEKYLEPVSELLEIVHG